MQELDAETDAEDVDVCDPDERTDAADDSEQEDGDDADARLAGHLSRADDEDWNDGKDPIGDRVLETRQFVVQMRLLG